MNMELVANARGKWGSVAWPPHEENNLRRLRCRWSSSSSLLAG